jgi:type II secretory ATPase GspE/PulE/Tfp pilus assembly ATPase PilB-like protein
MSELNLPGDKRGTGEDQVFVWPTPPYASFPSGTPLADAVQCEVEGENGHVRECLFVSMKPAEGVALVKVSRSRVNMPLRFSMFRRLTLKDPLYPTPAAGTQGDQHERDRSALLNYRPTLRYCVEFADGSKAEGSTIGHVETTQGVFVFHPLGDDEGVERVFFPHDSNSGFRIGEAIGQVLVQQRAVTPEQVEKAAREQAALRNRKLGDYLVSQEIVKPDQLLEALEAQARMPMVRIGEALTALELISPEQLEQTLERQKSERTVPLGELLVQSGQLSRQNLQIALARKMGYPVVDASSFSVEVEALRFVPFSLARKLNILPLVFRNNLLVIAAEDPSRRDIIDELEFTLQAKVVAALANLEVLDQAIGVNYSRHGLADTGRGRGPETEADEADPMDASQLLETLELGSREDESSEEQIEQSDNSLVRLINTMIIDAHGQGVSDIHIETHPSRRKIRIRFRRDGKLKPYMELPHTYRSALVARIKIMCDLDISERRKPQDGKIEFGRFSSQHPLELRVATIPTQGGAEDVVMRLLASAKPLPLVALGLTERNLRFLRESVERPYGMVLCVGPTGSGKTTTLHSVLQHLNTPDRKIWTAEDPIEISNPDLRQVQVNPKISWTFAKALRAFLRADPDVIMVGEIRDDETAGMAIEASLTGHLVLSTLHTNSAPETVTRLLDIGMDPFNFADSLLAVLAQRLVRRLCKDCREVEIASEDHVQELLEDYLHAFPTDLRPSIDALRQEWLDHFGEKGRLLRYQAPGCPRCEGTGYRGRLGLHELMVNDATIRRLIQTNGRPEQMQHAAMSANEFRTLRQDGILKVLAGATTIEEVRANCNA